MKEKRALVKNAADAEQVANAKRVANSTKKSQINDLYDIMQAAQGKRFLANLLALCGIHKSSYTGDNMTFFLEGQRNVGLQLLSEMMDADPKLAGEILHQAKEG